MGLERLPARRGNARLSRTLEMGRGDRRKYRNANNTTTQDDLNPDFFEQDSGDQICVRLGGGLAASRSGIKVDVGEGLEMKGNQIQVSKGKFIDDLRGESADITDAERDAKMNELLGILRGLVLEKRSQ